MDSIEQKRFWKNASPQVQEENFDIFLDLVKENRSGPYQLGEIFSYTDPKILKKHNLELINLIKTYKEEPLFENCWKYLKAENQKENIEILLEKMEEFKSGKEETSEELEKRQEKIYGIWSKTDKKVQSEMLGFMLEKYAEDKEVSKQIFKATKIQVPLKEFKQYIKLSGKKIDHEKQAHEVYAKIFKLNEALNDTINLDILNSKFSKIFEVQQLARITTYNELQDKILTYSKKKGFETIFHTVSKDSENWVMELDNLIKNLDQYQELNADISKEEIDANTANQLIQVFSQKENYFNISKVSQAKEYYAIRKETCHKLLNDEKIENLNPVLAEYSKEDQKRFALLEMMYGIDLEEGKNLVQKYGKNIEEIDANHYGKETVLSLVGIKRILECDKIEEIYNNNKEIIDNELETIEYATIATLEANLLDMYAKMYEEALDPIKPEDKLSQIEYEGKKIDVYKVTGNCNMFVRVEGACHSAKEANNFKEHLERPGTRYHGNCKTFMGRDSISLAGIEKKTVKFGYLSCKKGSLLAAAPWDIVSNGINQEFSTASAKWDTKRGIQFETPQNMKNDTRAGYSEFDSDKLIYNQEEEKFERDMPDFVLYLQEPEVEKELDDTWRVSQKAASQLGIPIRILDVKECVQEESKIVDHWLKMFLGEEENKENIPETQLIEQIIVKFENNATGVKNFPSLRDHYFGNQQRADLMKDVWLKIRSFESKDFAKYEKLVNKFVEVVEKEEAKNITVTGERVSKSRYGEGYIAAIKGRQKEANEKALQMQDLTTKEEKENPNEKLHELYVKFCIGKEDLAHSKKDLENEKNQNNKEEALAH